MPSRSANTPTATAVGRGGVFEHRFVGLFTVAAMNADVLEIPMIAHRVRDALTLAGSDPSHPGQLLLDVIQTVPRPELFTLSAERLLAMAKAVVDLGSQRRALLFLRADRLQFFVSCLVYLPRDRYTTPVRLQIEDILVREFGGTQLEFTARVSESPWALMHFMVRLPEDSLTGLRRHLRSQPHPHPGVAERSRPNLGRPADRRSPDSGSSATPTPSTMRRRSRRPTSRPSRRPRPSTTSPSSRNYR